MKTLAGKTILVVEDSAPTRESLEMALREEGYYVRAAANGKEALECLRTPPPPDLILLDMLMPVLDGWHFLEQIRRETPAACAIPIVVVTVGITSEEWAAAHGCAGFVRKPVELDALFSEIRRCC